MPVSFATGRASKHHPPPPPPPRAHTTLPQINLELPGMGDDWPEVIANEGWDYLNTRDAVYGYPWAAADNSTDDFTNFRVPQIVPPGGVAFFVGVVHTSANKTLYNRYEGTCQ